MDSLSFYRARYCDRQLSSPPWLEGEFFSAGTGIRDKERSMIMMKMIMIAYIFTSPDVHFGPTKTTLSLYANALLMLYANTFGLYFM